MAIPNVLPDADVGAGHRAFAPAGPRARRAHRPEAAARAGLGSRVEDLESGLATAPHGHPAVAALPATRRRARQRLLLAPWSSGRSSLWGERRGRGPCRQRKRKPTGRDGQHRYPPYGSPSRGHPAEGVETTRRFSAAVGAWPTLLGVTGSPVPICPGTSKAAVDKGDGTVSGPQPQRGGPHDDGISGCPPNRRRTAQVESTAGLG